MTSQNWKIKYGLLIIVIVLLSTMQSSFTIGQYSEEVYCRNNLIEDFKNLNTENSVNKVIPDEHIHSFTKNILSNQSFYLELRYAIADLITQKVIE